MYQKIDDQIGYQQLIFLKQWVDQQINSKPRPTADRLEILLEFRQNIRAGLDYLEQQHHQQQIGFKVGDMVVVMKDEVGLDTGIVFFKAGEQGRVSGYYQSVNGNYRIQVQSLNPSYNNGLWYTSPENLWTISPPQLTE